MRNRHCLMLDVDGVLVDGSRWDQDLQQDLGLAPDVLARSFFRTEWNDIIVGRKDLLPTLSKVLRRVAPKVDAAELVAYWFEKDSGIVESVLSDVRAARRQGTPVYLTTNQEHLRAAYLMQNMGLRDEVDGIVYSANAGSKKPQAAFFAFAVHATGRQPHELLLVDDTLPNIKGAQSAGWQAVHWDGTEDLSTILRRTIA